MSLTEMKEKFFRPGDERTILSYCFKSMDYFYDLSSKITESDFLADSHQMLYVMLKELATSGITKFDIAMVVNNAQGSDVLDMIGGASYVQSIANIQASHENFQSYIDNILEASTKFQTYVALDNHIKSIEKNAQSGKTSMELISSIEANMLDMTSMSMLNDDPITFGDDLESFIEQRKDKRIEMTGLSTGYPILDRQIDGLIAGTLMVIAARKKMGKSALLTNIALHNAYKLDIPVLYIDTELTYTEFSTRGLSIVTGIKERDIKHGGYSREQISKLKICGELVKKGKLFHKYMPGYSVDKVVALCKKYKMKENIGLIVFDYLKEPDLSTVDGNRKEHQLLGDITTKLKDLAGILNVPVLTAVQLNRQHDIADSDRIARYGDIISFWQLRTKEEKEQGGEMCGQFKLIIKDTRRGGSTSEEGIGYMFHKTRLTIREVSPVDQYFMNQGGEVTNADDFDDTTYKNDYIDGDELA